MQKGNDKENLFGEKACGDAEGTIFDIKKFAIHDGPGIRTTVFLKGCPLRCAWCHNPESIESSPEISFLPEKCIGCGRCFEVCPNKCHVIIGKERKFLRKNCERCGLCAEGCYAMALEQVGRPATVKEVIKEVLKDRPFYETSGGGMTISGGEPMAQPEFTRALLATAKKHGLHTCLDTSGFAARKYFESVLPFVDIFLYDYKETDPAKHLEFTGVDREPIMSNLAWLDRQETEIILRCPLIPGLNTRNEHFTGIAHTANSLENITQIDIHPYHPLGESKCRRIGKSYNFDKTKFAAEEDIAAWITFISDRTDIPVVQD